jgi:catabolite regulation protein CreA
MVEPKQPSSEVLKKDMDQSKQQEEVFKDDANIFDQSDHVFRGIDPLDTRPHEQEYIRKKSQ